MLYSGSLSLSMLADGGKNCDRVTSVTTNSTERLLLDALHRILALEDRVTLLEREISGIPAGAAPNSYARDEPIFEWEDEIPAAWDKVGQAVTHHDETDKDDKSSVRSLAKAFTRSAALEEFKRLVKTERPDITMLGKLNRGNNPLRAVTSDGDEHRIYFSASRNYDGNDDGRFVGWLTIAIDDIMLANYAAFVFAIQDVAGNFHYLIFGHNELENLVKQKYQPDSRGYIHFSIAGDSAHPGKYAQLRGEPADFTPYANSWYSLPTTPPF